MLWNWHKAKILQCPSLFGTKTTAAERCGAHAFPARITKSHSFIKEIYIADIEQGQWWIQAEYRFCDIGSCFIHNSKADISWPVKKLKTFEIMWNSSSWMTIVPSWFYLQKNLKLNA